MITPAFMGMYTAQNAIMAAQMALNTVNHNISNANTEGFSRQRIELVQARAYTDPSLLGQTLSSGQVGMGVNVEGIERSRDAFLDGQFRYESSRFNSNTTYNDALSQIDGIMGEPSDTGANQAMQDFFASLQQLSINPQDLATRQNVIQSAVSMVTVFQQQAYQLQQLQYNLVGNPAQPASIDASQLGVSVSNANNLLTGIADLNRQILNITAAGATPNDLLDKRDMMLDELSEYVNIDVTHIENNQIQVRVANQLMIDGVTLEDTLQTTINPGPAPDPNAQPVFVETVSGGVDIINTAAPNQLTAGKIRGLINVAGSDPYQTTVWGTITELDTLLTTVIDEVNTLHLAGRDITGTTPTDPLFEPNPVSATGLNIFDIEVNANVAANPNLIAAASGSGTFLGPGDGSNALDMAKLLNTAQAALGGNTFAGEFNGIISKLGVDSNSILNRAESQSGLMDQLLSRRESISGVNIDQEMVDMLRFQRAFEASSKILSILNQLTDTIIGMV